jgi:biotin transport system ATP-binding protein
MVDRGLPAFDASAIDAVGLGFRFTDGAWAFRGVDFALRFGEIAVLAGRNGAGKTILAKNLAGLLQATEGSVRLGGREIASIKGSLATEVGYVFQDARLQLVGETVLDDALFGPISVGIPMREAVSRAEKALRDCGLFERRNMFVHRLSGGELRRLAIAGALALGPKAMILDEPFANLDPEGIKGLIEITMGMARDGIAILVVTHEIEKVLGLATRFSVMDGGGIVLSGPPAEVLAEGIESYGLRDPFSHQRSLEDLAWN